MADMAPCNWPLFIPDTASGDCFECESLSELTKTSREHVVGMATDLLWNWTGRKFGTCPVTVFPCRQRCDRREPLFWANPVTGRAPLIPQVGGWTPALIGGEWFNLPCGVCSSRQCSCRAGLARSIVLPGPVEEVTEIWLDGVLVGGEDYFIRDGVLFLTAQSGLVFPDCNTPGGDPQVVGGGAWSISYERGYPVPLGGQLATYRLACELANAMCGRDCALPSRVSSITRQGVSMAILDDFQNLEEGRTGIWEIDSWLSAVTQKREARPVVWSPDFGLGGQRGTSAGLARGTV